MGAEYRIRMATPDDAAVIARHRAAMFRDMGEVNDGEAARLEAAAFVHLRQMLADRRYVGWLAECGGEVVAGGGAIISQTLPRPRIPDGGAAALVLNVYTEPGHRHRGLARRVMEAVLDWCGRNHIAVVSLHASAEGRPLYERLGFAPTNEMRWNGTER